MKKLGFVGALALVAAFAFAALSSGASASEPGGGSGGGTGGLPFNAIPGVLDAEGDGIVAGAGLLNMRLCADHGILLVKRATQPSPAAPSRVNPTGWGSMCTSGFTTVCT